MFHSNVIKQMNLDIHVLHKYLALLKRHFVEKAEVKMCKLFINTFWHTNRIRVDHKRN